MRVLLVTMGSRGDVEQFAALAEALVRAGHEALLAAPRELARFVDHALALAPFTQRVIYLEEGDRVALTRERVEVVDRDGNRVREYVSVAGTDNNCAGGARRCGW